MEKHLCRVVNSAFEGQPQNIVLQVLETNKVIPFSKIKSIVQNEETKNVSVNDSDIGNENILHILNNMSHQVEVSFDENDFVTLYF